MIDVRAILRGYCGGVLREPGDVFQIESRDQFSEIWMERCDSPKGDGDGRSDPKDEESKFSVKQEGGGAWSVISPSGELVASGLKRGKAYALAAEMREKGE